MVDLGASISKGLPAGEMLVDQRARDRRRPSPHNSALLIRGRTEAGNRQSIFRVVDHEVIDHVIDGNQRGFIGRFDQRPSHSHQRKSTSTELPCSIPRSSTRRDDSDTGMSDRTFPELPECAELRGVRPSSCPSPGSITPALAALGNSAIIWMRRYHVVPGP